MDTVTRIILITLLTAIGIPTGLAGHGTSPEISSVSSGDDFGDGAMTTTVDPVDFVNVTNNLEAVDLQRVSLLNEAEKWAVDLFAQAGLDLPPLRFVHHLGNMEPCRGRAGQHYRADGISIIDVCAGELSLSIRVTILHETAHAWAAHALTAERKAEFQGLRGFTYWNDYEAAEWHENGSEQAADIIAWGLIDRPIENLRIEHTSCDELDAGYRTLTGADPLNGLRDTCET